MNKRAPLIAAGVALLLVALTFFFLVKPKMGQVSAARTDLLTKQAEGGTLTASLATLRDDQANASKYQNTIDMVDQRVPPLLDQQGLISLLREAASQSGVDSLSAQFSAPTVTSASGVSTTPISVSLQGRYFTIAEFFDKIEILSRAAKVTQFTLALGGTASAGSPPTGTMLVQCTIEFYTSDTSSGPGSIPGSQPPVSFGPSSAPPATPSPSGAP